MLVEEGFKVVSMDASDRMLKYALKERWNRRKEPAFDQWGKILQILFLTITLSRRHLVIIRPKFNATTLGYCFKLRAYKTR